MILRDDGLGVPQTAHSALTGRIAEAWRIDPNLPADDLVVAATIHDLGWTDWERDPPIDPSTGRPPPFFALPPADHAAIWTAGTDAAATFGRWIGLLVSMHCTRLMGWRQQSGNSSAEIDALVERERSRQASLRSGLDDAVVDRASGLIATWDGLSLDLCGGKTPTFDDWPFREDAVELTVDARRLDGDEWETLAFHLTR